MGRLDLQKVVFALRRESQAERQTFYLVIVAPPHFCPLLGRALFLYKDKRSMNDRDEKGLEIATEEVEGIVLYRGREFICMAFGL